MKSSALFSLGVLAALVLAGCNVNVTGRSCAGDQDCAYDQICTPGPDGGTAGSCQTGVRTFETGCPLLMEAVAARATACYGASVGDWLLTADSAGICADLLADFKGTSPGFTFDPRTFGVCQQNLAALSCDQFFIGQASNDIGFKFAERANDAATSNMLSACAAIAPQKTNGQACNTTADCNGGFCDASATCPGVCKPFVAASAACTETDRCVPGSVCLNQFCVPLAQKGETCGDSNPCNPTLYCNGGTCETRGAVGAECANNAGCAQNLRCLAGTAGSTCQPAKTLGQTCTADSAHPQCDLFLYCSSGGNCAAWPHAAGLACGNGGGKAEAVLCLNSFCSTRNLVTYACEAYVDTGNNCNLIGALGACGPDGQCINNICRPRNCP